MDSKAPKTRIIIVGGGTSGWMTATALSAVLPHHTEITLVESAEIGIIGVGEATLPHIRNFNQKVGINEAAFMKATHATFKLGIEFVDWGAKGRSYIHPFGDFGVKFDSLAFYHHWLQAGRPDDIESWSLPILAARKNRFTKPDKGLGIMSSFGYAYQFDAILYGRFLRELCEKRGVKRIEGKVVDVSLRPEDGFITSLKLENGQEVTGDLFVDCSGFRGLLIEGTYKTGYESWKEWMPCDRAVAVPCERTDDFTPYTRATARDAGWQWRIPLQHRTGNGYVYASQFIDEASAQQTLMDHLDAPALADPRHLQFHPGKRKKSWVKNCVCVGLSGGFLEPLESTSIYLIQIAATTLTELFPTLPIDPRIVDEFNRVIDLEYERVRDFLILHYHATVRDDTPFWDYVRTMTIPDSLAYKMELFRQQGHIVQYKDGLFLPPSWLAVYLGQGIVPDDCHPMAKLISDEKRARHMQEIRSQIDQALMRFEDHDAYIKRHIIGERVA